ncbi:hypothetical protein RFI_15968 [Reticulomyxa filosa]|uniref:Uncharacterized protein n=1 Tax=Reticulomyxa filosa TaxID=46433 RepID=X6N7E8_RETFI|nr:hypothetical protein RFI_15968 [Reticulomyxa filosa]|eukprot:ETO21237.1 hypothetical protein RFI_15968 [Reticulomyxa filosa]
MFDGDCEEDMNKKSVLCAQQGGLLAIDTADMQSVSKVSLATVHMRRGTSEVGGAFLIRHNVNSTLELYLKEVTFEKNNATQLTQSSDMGLFQSFEGGLNVIFSNLSDDIKAISWPTRVQFEVADTTTCPNCPMFARLQAFDYFNHSYTPIEYCDVSGACSFIQLQLKCVTNYTDTACPTDQQFPRGHFINGAGNISFVATPGKLGESVTVSLECMNNLVGSICPLSESLHSTENNLQVPFVDCSSDLRSKEYVSSMSKWFTCDQPNFPNYDVTKTIGNNPPIISAIVLIVVALFLVLVLGILHNSGQLVYCEFCRMRKVEGTYVRWINNNDHHHSTLYDTIQYDIIIACGVVALFHTNDKFIDRYITLKQTSKHIIVCLFVLLLLLLGGGGGIGTLKDINLCQTFWRCYSYLKDGGIGGSKEVWLALSILVTVFIVLPWTANVFYALRIKRHTHAFMPYNKHSRTMYQSKGSLFMLLVACCGDLYVTLSTMNCRLFGLHAFYLGLTLPELREFAWFKVITTTVLENMMQVVLQLVALFYTEQNTATDVDGSIYLAMILSLMSMLAMILTFWLRKNDLVVKYSFELTLDLNMASITNSKKRQLLVDHIRRYSGRFETIAETLANGFEHLHRKQILIGNIIVTQHVLHVYGNILLPDQHPQWAPGGGSAIDSYVLVPDQENDSNIPNLRGNSGNKNQKKKKKKPKINKNKNSSYKSVNVSAMCKELLMHGFELNARYGALLNSNKLLFNAEFKIFESNYSVRSPPISGGFLTAITGGKDPSVSVELSDVPEQEASVTASGLEVFYDELKNIYRR